MTTTALDMINLAMREAGVLGVGQTLLPEDYSDALRLLNAMLAQWQRRSWLDYHWQDFSVPCTGALSYTIGPGGNIDTARPDQIESAFFRQTQQTGALKVDYPLEILPSRADYNRITLKDLTSFAYVIFYDAAMPLGVLYPWPLLTNQYELHVTIKVQLQSFDALTDQLSMPPEYEEAIHYNLAVRLRPAYQLPPDQTITALAKASLNTIRNANAQVAMLQMPGGLVRGSGYNVYSDQP